MIADAILSTSMRKVLVFTQLILLVGCSVPAPDVVQFAPTVSGEEKTTRAGKDHLVRWLQRRSEFEIQHQGGPERVKIGFRVASYLAQRHVWLEQDGQALPAREVVQKSFWEGGEVLVTNTVTLQAGRNLFAIVTDGDSVDVTPGRPVFLLLDGGIELDKPTQR